MLFTWLMLAGFILLFTPRSLTSKFQGAFSRIFSLPLRIGRSASLSAKMPQSSEHLYKRKIAQYENHIANLNEEILDKQNQVEMLSGLRNRFHALEDAKLVTADIIRATLEGSHNEIVINRGQSDGLYNGLFVIADNGIIGEVSYVWSRTARVRLISDTSSKISVRIKGLSKSALMQGYGNSLAKIQWARQNIETGENVIAEKKPGFLDGAMITGKVAYCNRNQDSPLLWDIIVKPVCDLERLTKVAVIIMNPQQK